MKVKKLLHRGRSRADARFKHQLGTYRKLTQPVSNTILETINLHRLLLPELEVDIVLVCRDALRYFFLALMLLFLVSTITDNPQT